MATAVVTYVAASVAIFPHYLAYFNAFAGGPLNGWRYLIDSNLDWGQDSAAARRAYVKRSETRVIQDPGGPTVGRILINVNSLVGLKPQQANRYAWLRENFEPVDHVGYSWHVYDVDRDGLERCCSDSIFRLNETGENLATSARPIGGGEGVTVYNLPRLNDGLLGANSRFDAAVTQPGQPYPFSAWFGLQWRRKVSIGRVVAYPSYFSRGNQKLRYRAVAVVLDHWQDGVWLEIPGTRREHGEVGEADRIEWIFPEVITRKLRLRVIESRDKRGRWTPDRPRGRYRVAVLELAAFAADSEAGHGAQE